MAGQTDFFVAMGLGVGPALLTLWFSLRRFDRPHMDHTLFDDRRVFGSLAAGMIFGVLASVLSVAVQQPSAVGFFAVLALVLAVEEGFKVVYLNRRAYRGRFDTTFYGVALGVGAASTAVAASAVWNPGSLSAPATLVFLGVFSLSLGLANAVSGSVIGFGASQGDTWKPFAQAVGIRYAHFALLSPFVLLAGTPEALFSAIGLVTSLVFALILYGWVYAYLLPGTLPEDIRRKIRRARRRTQAVKE
jgi:hypothetical protein